MEQVNFLSFFYLSMSYLDKKMKRILLNFSIQKRTALIYALFSFLTTTILDTQRGTFGYIKYTR